MSETTRTNDKTASKVNPGTMAKECYEAKVVGEALGRAGRNPQIKGTIHEVLVKDRLNLKPANLLKGQTIRLTKSTTAKAVDLVGMKGGKVVQRLQLKDVVSSGGLSKTVKQVKAGQYRASQLLATKESAAALAKKGINVQSSGVSTETTSYLAAKAGVSKGLGGALKTAAKSGGAVGAVVEGGVELAKGLKDYRDGVIDGPEYAANVTKAAIGGGASWAAASVASTASAGVVATGAAALGLGAAATTATVLAVPLAVGIVAACGAKKVWDCLVDFFDL